MPAPRPIRPLLLALITLVSLIPAMPHAHAKPGAKPGSYACTTSPDSSMIPGTYTGSFRIRIVVQNPPATGTLTVVGSRLEVTVDESGELSGTSDLTYQFDGSAGFVSREFNGSGTLKDGGSGKDRFRLAGSVGGSPSDLSLNVNQKSCTSGRGDFLGNTGTIGQLFSAWRAQGAVPSMRENTWSVEATPDTKARADRLLADARSRAEAIPLTPRSEGRAAIFALLGDLDQSTPEFLCVADAIANVIIQRTGIWMGEMIEEAQKLGTGEADAQASHDDLATFRKLGVEMTSLDMTMRRFGCAPGEGVEEALGAAVRRLADDFLTLKDYFAAIYADRQADLLNHELKGFYQEVEKQAKMDADRDFGVLKNAGAAGAPPEQLHQRAQIARTSEEIYEMISREKLGRVNNYCSTKPELC